jgi:hypothetical protein
VLPEFLPVIRKKHENRILEKTERPDMLDEPPELPVHGRDFLSVKPFERGPFLPLSEP